jgi:hypothetical protein
MSVLFRFLVLKPPEQGRIVEAVLCLLAARLALALLPFPRALRWLRVAEGEACSGRVDADKAHEFGRAIAIAARHVPFRAVCLEQAFAALLMLRRHGLAGTVHLGLARGAGVHSIAAHAWCRCGEMPVTGADAAQAFVSVAVFEG